MTGIQLPYIINGSVVFVDIAQLPPAGTGTVIYYSPNYLHR